MKDGVAPCKDCPLRNVGCHEGCPKYASWRKEYEESHKRQLEEARKERWRWF